MYRFMTSTPKSLDRLIAAAAPVADAQLSAAGLESPLDRLGELIVASNETPLRRRRRRVAVALVAAAMLVPGAALGGVFSTHTGIHPRPGTENDGSELLLTNAPDFPPLVRRLIADIPFPPGSASLSSRAATYVRLFAQPNSTVQAAGIKGTLYGWAGCAWRTYWVQAHHASRTGDAAVAAARLREIGLANRRWDSFWHLYVEVAQLEAAGNAWAPAQYAQYYRVNCVPNAHLWDGR